MRLGIEPNFFCTPPSSALALGSAVAGSIMVKVVMRRAAILLIVPHLHAPDLTISAQTNTCILLGRVVI
jgi:hypothetical protein